MSILTTALALRAAINVLRDSAECRRMPSGEFLDDAGVKLYFDAADIVLVATGGASAVWILADRKPPTVKAGPKGFEISWA